MSLPTISGTARVVEDGELRFSPSGVAVLKVRIVFNGRRKADDGSWQDDKQFWITGVMFKQAAESAAEVLVKGVEVVVTGRLCTEQWEDRNGGGKRSAPSLLIDSIGPAVNNIQTAKVSKLDRTNGGQTNSGFGGQQTSRQQASNDDPWANQSETVPF